MKRQKVKAMLTTLAVTSAVTMQPSMVAFADEGGVDLESQTSENEKSSTPTTLEEAKSQYDSAKEADEKLQKLNLTARLHMIPQKKRT